MKKLIFLLILIFPLFSLAQSSVIYAEYHSLATEKTFITDYYQVQLYDNVMGLDNPDDSVSVSNSGFQVKMTFYYDSNQDSLRVAYTNSYNGFKVGNKGIVRLKMYDVKLYAYVYVTEIQKADGIVNVVFVGMPNVPQRKKLLFKDSPRLRMWRYPWIGE